MTMDKFFERLQLAMSSPRYTPFVDAFDEIRIVDENNWTFCPLTLVCWETTGYIFEEYQADDAAWAMGMDWREAGDIAEAEDFKDHPLRSKLYDAVFSSRLHLVS